MYSQTCPTITVACYPLQINRDVFTAIPLFGLVWFAHELMMYQDILPASSDLNVTNVWKIYCGGHMKIVWTFKDGSHPLEWHVLHSHFNRSGTYHIVEHMIESPNSFVTTIIWELCNTCGGHFGVYLHSIYFLKKLFFVI